MNKKQRQTLKKIFDRPTRADVAWRDVASLLKACGADIKEGDGSKVKAMLNGQILRIHKPHPRKEFKKWAVEEIRGFLESAGVTL